ncbi:recombination protein NinG, partial [Yersinia sp. IP36721]
MAKLPKSRNCKVCKTRFKPAAIYEWWCCEE